MYRWHRLASLLLFTFITLLLFTSYSTSSVEAKKNKDETTEKSTNAASPTKWEKANKPAAAAEVPTQSGTPVKADASTSSSPASSPSPSPSSTSTLSSSSSPSSSTPSSARILSRQSRFESKRAKQSLQTKRLATHRSKLDSQLINARKHNASSKQNRLLIQSNRKERKLKLQSKIDQFHQTKLEFLKPTHIIKTKDKSKWMEEKSRNSTSGVINITGTDFKNYVNTTPRPYHIFVSLTTLADRYQCDKCKQTHNATEDIARVYKNYRENKTATALNSSSSEMSEDDIVKALTALSTDTTKNLSFIAEEAYDRSLKRKLPVYFVELDVDVDGGRSIFDALSLSSIPYLFLLPPTISSESIELSSFLSSVPYHYKFGLISHDIEADGIGSLIADRTRRRVKEKEQIDFQFRLQRLTDEVMTLDIISTVYICILVFLFGVLGIGILYHNYGSSPSSSSSCTSPWLTHIYNDSIDVRALTPMTLSRFWLILISWFFFIFTSGGCMYCILNSTEIGLYYYHGNEQTGLRIFSNNARLPPWVSESYAIGVMNVGLGALLVWLNVGAHVTKRWAIEEWESKKSQPIPIWRRMINALIWIGDSLLGPLFLILLIIRVWSFYVEVYDKKNESYNHGFSVGSDEQACSRLDGLGKKMWN